jgi:hypothetical protein
MRLVRTLAALAALSLAALPAHATTFSDGEFVTWSQVAWGGDPAPGNISGLLEMNFNSFFAPSGLLEVGIPGAAGFSLIFDNADAVITYLPGESAAGVLTADLLDPVASASGTFGGEVVTATLNVAFSDAGLLAHPPDVAFGDLVFQNLDLFAAEHASEVGPEIAELDGSSVRAALSDADLVLGGAASPFTFEDMFILLNFSDMAFNAGTLGTAADTFLTLPPSTATTVPEPSTLATLLIGFAGLGFVRYRTSRRSSAGAGSSGLSQSRG